MFYADSFAAALLATRLPVAPVAGLFVAAFDLALEI
jgi:hypothetical protein